MVTLAQLEPHMISNQEIRTKNGLLLLAKWQEVTFPVIACLASLAKTVGVMEPFSVLARCVENSTNC